MLQIHLSIIDESLLITFLINRILLILTSHIYFILNMLAPPLLYKKPYQKIINDFQYTATALNEPLSTFSIISMTF